MIGKMGSAWAFCATMGKVAAEGTGVTVVTGSTSSTAGRTNIEQDADDFAAECPVNPLALLIGNESRDSTLVFLVGMRSAAEVASERIG